MRVPFHKKHWYIIWQCVKTNSTPVVHIKIAGKWMFIPLKMVLIGIDLYPYILQNEHIRPGGGCGSSTFLLESWIDPNFPR